MQYVVIVPTQRKRITLLPGVTMQYIEQTKREIKYQTDDLTTLVWQLLVNMPEREAIALLAEINADEMEVTNASN